MSGLLKLALATSVLVITYAQFDLKFAGTRFPNSSFDKHNPYSSTSAQINGNHVEVIFETIIRTGDVINDVTFGMLVDIHGDPIKDIKCINSAKEVCIANKSQRRSLDTVCQSSICATMTTQEQSDDLDYSSFIPIIGTDRIRVMSHFEAPAGQMSTFIITVY